MDKKIQKFYVKTKRIYYLLKFQPCIIVLFIKSEKIHVLKYYFVNLCRTNIIFKLYFAPFTYLSKIL